jgi:hypothetical protein
MYDELQSQGSKLSIILSKGGGDTLRDFKKALKQQNGEFIAMLVDSEAPVTTASCWRHLAVTNKWKSLNYAEEQCYLMVQAMEAWFFADITAVEDFFGQGFQRSAMGNTADVEAIPREELYRRLNKACRNTKKGKYSKGNHSTALLLAIDPALVRKSPHCNRIFTELPKAVAQM